MLLKEEKELIDKIVNLEISIYKKASSNLPVSSLTSEKEKTDLDLSVLIIQRDGNKNDIKEAEDLVEEKLQKKFIEFLSKEAKGEPTKHIEFGGKSWLERAVLTGKPKVVASVLFKDNISSLSDKPGLLEIAINSLNTDMVKLLASYEAPIESIPKKLKESSTKNFLLSKLEDSKKQEILSIINPIIERNELKNSLVSPAPSFTRKASANL